MRSSTIVAIKQIIEEINRNRMRYVARVEQKEIRGEFWYESVKGKR
jgi:hypothetical protein